jgi:UDP-GlcNAc:undecaprenyl-phosphate/decaprenyl-phosphate GlcNAc-1-phosphate transferase
MPFLIALAASLVLTPVAGFLGRRLGMVDRPGDDLKIHAREVPTLGGLAVVAAVGLATLASGIALPPWGVVAATLLALFVGTVDDALPLPPILRGSALTAAGVVLVVGAGHADLGLAAGVALVLLVLACANGVNILDGQDGLAAGVGAVAALGLTGSLWLATDMAAPLPAALGGALAGFAFWNRPPARVYLGNGGAYAVGLLLAVPSIALVLVAGWRGLLAAGACLAVPAFEIAFTVGRRTLSGKSLATGDRLHSYDLVAARVGRARSTVVFVVLAVLGAAAGLLITILPLPIGVVFALVGAGLGVLYGIQLWSRRPVTT